MYRESYIRLVYRLELISEDIACYYEIGDIDELRSSITNLLDLVSTAKNHANLLDYDIQKQNSLIADDDDKNVGFYDE